MCYSGCEFEKKHPSLDSGECRKPSGIPYPCVPVEEKPDGNYLYSLYKTGHISLSECRRRMEMK